LGGITPENPNLPAPPEQIGGSRPVRFLAGGSSTHRKLPRLTRVRRLCRSFPPMIQISRAVSWAGSPPFSRALTPRIRSRLCHNPVDCSGATSAAGVSLEGRNRRWVDTSGKSPAYVQHRKTLEPAPGNRSRAFWIAAAAFQSSHHRAAQRTRLRATRPTLLAM